MTTTERLARFRPATLARLRRALAWGTTPVVLLGPRGSGLGDLAILAAQILLCDEGGCGTCDACRAIAEGRHPEVRMLQDSSPVGEIRELVAFAQQSSASWRVAGLVGIERMAQAAPILLKAVEEPGSALRWILAGSAVPPELAPLVSRCVRVPVEPTGPEEVAELLASLGVELSPELVALLPGDLGVGELLGDLPDPAAWLDAWASLPERAHREHPAELAARLAPPRGLASQRQVELVRLGLGVLARRAAIDVVWVRRAQLAAVSLQRRLSVALVLAELVAPTG